MNLDQRQDMHPKQFSLISLLVTTSILSIGIACFLRFPGPTILALSCIPLLLVLRTAKRGAGSAAEIRLIMLVAITITPPYFAAGPIVAGGH